jgi:hypothetical protein
MDKLKSRKFWLAVVGSIGPILGQYFSQEFTLEQALTASSAILISYIFGQAYVDGKAVDGSNPVKELADTKVDKNVSSR